MAACGKLDHNVQFNRFWLLTASAKVFQHSHDNQQASSPVLHLGSLGGSYINNFTKRFRQTSDQDVPLLPSWVSFILSTVLTVWKSGCLYSLDPVWEDLKGPDRWFPPDACATIKPVSMLAQKKKNAIRLYLCCMPEHNAAICCQKSCILTGWRVCKQNKTSCLLKKITTDHCISQLHIAINKKKTFD